MASLYQHASDWIPGTPSPFSGVIRSDGKWVACAAESQDWEDYLEWASAEGNVVDPYLSPAAGGVTIVLGEGEVAYGAMLGSLPPTDPGPPVMVDVPYASGSGVVGEPVECTMGNWQGEPRMYDYRWLSDAPADLSSGNIYIVREEDVGHIVFCVVTATNDSGSTGAPPSNGVMAVAAPTEEALVPPPPAAPNPPLTPPPPVAPEAGRVEEEGYPGSLAPPAAPHQTARRRHEREEDQPPP